MSAGRTEESGLELIEDSGRPRGASISTVSSEPLVLRGGRRAGSRSSSVVGDGGDTDNGSADDDDDGQASGVPKSPMLRDGGSEGIAGAPEQRVGGGTRGVRRFHALEDADVRECAFGDANTVGQHQSIAMDLVSEAAVAEVDSVILSSSTIVASRRAGTLVCDVGTRMCLSDGTVLGVVSTLLGPIASCSYAILCDPSRLASLAMDSKVGEGTPVHYDVSVQRVLYDPLVQCDPCRGCDASFLDDAELPPTARPDFSDDDEERAWKKRRRGGEPRAESSSSDESEVEFDNDGRVISYRPRRRRVAS